LLINQQEVKLTITSIPGICSKCQINKEIKLIAQRNDRLKEYCLSCSLNALCQLEQSNYQFTDKEQTIKELWEELNNKQTKLWSNYYSCKKPTCLSCLQQGIKENEYNFCGDNCLVKSWIQYHGQVNLKERTESHINKW
jgi:hypothetical protein